MHVTTTRWERDFGWRPSLSEIGHAVNCVLFFGSRETIEAPDSGWHAFRRQFPTATIAGCSTAGEIDDSHVVDHGLTAAALDFESTEVRASMVPIPSMQDSELAGTALGRALAAANLRHVLMLSDGTMVNGTALVRGVRAALPPEVHVTGGLAGDGPKFESTCVVLNDELRHGHVVALGLYGSDVSVAYGQAGGWVPFGPRRLITHSDGNVVYTIDDEPALALYKRYLGDLAGDLPAAGMLFPLQLLPEPDHEPGAVVRTFVGINDANQSVTFAGDMPQGHFVRLMRASADALIKGAGLVASHCHLPDDAPPAQFALLVSCVGRRLIMGQRATEELEAVVERLPQQATAIGFYSYGEISPGETSAASDLHNQTMTLTLFAEKSRK